MSMSKHLNHSKIALALRRSSPHWVKVDEAPTRSGVSGRAAAWRNPRRAPEAFVTTVGSFEFRTRRHHTLEGRFVLEGRYIPAGTTGY